MESYQSIILKLPILVLIIYAIEHVSGLEVCGSSYCWYGYHCCGSSGYCCPDGWICSGSVCINSVVIIVPCVIAFIVIVTIIIIIIVCKKKKAQGRVIQQPGHGNLAVVTTSQQPMHGYGQPAQPPIYPGSTQQQYGVNPAYPPQPETKQTQPVA